ncbi:MAG: hypothetical protein PHP45_03925 [Elusimicrobiales bacterium]|nr:hypothetical protein [Elusimicrobiales bacterium]
MKSSRISAALLLCLLSAGAVRAAETAFEIKKPAEKLRLGSPFQIELDALYPDGYSIRPDSSTASSGSFETMVIQEKSKAGDNGRLRSAFVFSVMPFDVGRATFPAVSWLLSAPDGSSATVKSPELPLEISSYSDNVKDADSLRDIRPPWKPFNRMRWLLLAAAAAALAAWFHWRRRRSRAAETAAGPAPDLRPAHVIALDELDKLASGPLWPEGRYKEFYNRLADIQRDYITRRMEVPAHNFNTAELCRELLRTGQDGQIVAALRKFFSGCDLVKFARYRPAAEERDADMELARTLIRRTEPPPPPQPVQLDAVVEAAKERERK